MSVAEGTSTVVALKKQVAQGTPVTGAGAALINVRPSAGLALQVATIESNILHRSGMKGRPRQGFGSNTGSYETELQAGNLDTVFAGVLGTTDASTALDESDLTSVTISGTGTILTFGGGDLIALGFYIGRWFKLTGMATSGNNSIWAPIVAMDATAKTVTIPSGYLVDETIDSAFGLVLAKTFRTVNPRPKEYFTVEEYLDIDQSKLGVDQRFNGLSFSAQPNQDVTAGFTLSGLDMYKLASGDAPNFTSPTDGTVSGAESMSMLDGTLIVNGVELMDVTGLTMGIAANSSITPLLRRRRGLGVSLAGFAFSGQITAVLTDTDTSFDDFTDETNFSLFAGFRQSNLLSSDFVGVAVTNAAYGNWNAPIVENDTIITLPLYAGRETRATASGWPTGSIMVISTSAA